MLQYLIVAALLAARACASGSASLWASSVGTASPLPSQTKNTIIKALTRQKLFCKDAYPSDVDKLRLSQWFNASGATPFQIYVHAGSDIVSTQVVSTGVWAQDLLKDIYFALEYGRKQDNPELPVFIDVGANFGWLSTNVAARGYRVVSVEALAKNQKMLRNTLCGAPDIMNHVVLLAVGLGNDTQHCFMYSLQSNEGNGNSVCGIPRTQVEAMLPPGTVIRSEMTVHRLDSLLLGLDVQVMKIDVEGFEPNVMYGAKELLMAGKIKFVCMEFFPDYMQRNMRNPNATIEFIEWLVLLPYRISILAFDHGYMTPEQARIALRGDRTRDDIFLAHKDLPLVANVR